MEGKVISIMQKVHLQKKFEQKFLWCVKLWALQKCEALFVHKTNTSVLYESKSSGVHENEQELNLMLNICSVF